ncbi:Cysteine proteinase inhibitor 5 [Linum perenne]
MATRSSLLSAILLVALISSFVATTMAYRVLYDPSWVPIKDVKDKKIVAIAEFAVKEYNKAYSFREPLKFVSVFKGEVLSDVGKNYHLYLTASTHLGNDKYQTFVFEVPSGQWSLTSFVKLVE